MEKPKVQIKNIELSLSDLLGRDYMHSVCEARAFVEEKNVEKLLAIAEDKVGFFPQGFADRLDTMIDLTGEIVVDPLPVRMEGATTDAFRKATHMERSPLTAYGFIRIGEDGRVYLTSKSEHYHTPLGHDFPGYKLVEHAKRLGIPNATHNNTRGYITRLLERELVRVANGIGKDDKEKLENTLASREPHILNRVINLETGSLAVEAAVKMMLTRFYRLDGTCPPPEYKGRTPVFLVMADHRGGKEANYHGTTILTQLMRGMWPDFYSALEYRGLFHVEPVGINDLDDFRDKVNKYERTNFKVAGFLHEIILMNYGGIKLDKEYLRGVYDICHENDIPVLVDEIQSCLWSPDFFMFREYGLKPDFVSIGKGFPGGQYPASRILTTASMDRLNLFGALVTNGQEELASLTYLVTMAFAGANQEYIRALGVYYEHALRNLAEDHRSVIEKTEGAGHMSTLFFRSAETAVAFASQLSRMGIDVSVQTYKADCPPSALTKIPLIASYKMIDFIVNAMREVLGKGREIE